MKTTSNAQLALADRMSGDLNTGNPRWHGQMTTLGVKTPAGGYVTCPITFEVFTGVHAGVYERAWDKARDAIQALDLELTDAEQDTLYGKIQKSAGSDDSLHAYCFPTGDDAPICMNIVEGPDSNGMVLVDVVVSFGLEVVVESLDEDTEGEG